MSDQPNRLYYGDNLDILRHHDYFPDACVDLIYLDPPFNSSRSYNVLFKDESGSDSEAQITAFEDTWHWGPKAEHTYTELVENAPERVGQAVGALRQIVGTNQMMAYLVMMAARLVELHRVLKPTGSLYLHCDPTASHYLKVILDTIFGPERFLGEIIWKRTSAHSSANRPGPIHDTILMYSKSKEYTWNQQYVPYDEQYLAKQYRFVEEGTSRRFTLSDLTGAGTRRGETGLPWRGIDVTSIGRHWMNPPSELDELDKKGRIYWPKKDDGMPRYKRYLDEMPGVHLQSIWSDISPVSSQAAERLNYPTQKPEALLERIISASSNPGDVVLDPFAGCGTAVAAAHKLGRRWIGIDITHLSIALLKYRMRDMFKLDAGKDYAVVGEPVSTAGARQLASEDRYQFQWWALSLVRARPLGGEIGGRSGKKGSDKGIDGVINFVEAGGKVARVVVQVKSGKVKSGDIRDLKGTVEREQAAIGVFVTLEEPSRDMLAEAVSAGYYESAAWTGPFPRIQILTIEDLLKGADVKMPQRWGTFKQAAQTEKPDSPRTRDMFGDT